MISLRVIKLGKKAYTYALKRVRTWLNENNHTTVTDLAMAEYVNHLHEAGQAYPSARLAVSAVAWFAKESGHPDPIGGLTRKALKAYRRQSAGRGRGQATSLRFEAVDAFAHLVRADKTLKSLRANAVLRLMSDGLLRVSELVSLEVSDIEVQPNGTGTVTIRKSKTDQEGEGRTLFLGKPTVNALNAWLNASGVTEGRIVRAINRHNQVWGEGVTTVTANKIVKESAHLLGVETSLHALRVGSAQSLIARGATMGQTMQAGRWNFSRMVAHYARNELASQGAMATIRYGS